MPEVIEVSSEDIQRYVESQVSGKKSPDSPPTANTPPSSQAMNPNSFTVSQQDYIDYLIDKRIAQRKNIKRGLFWSKSGDALLWLIKLIIGIAIFLFLCYGFYFLVWFMQNSLYFYRLNIPTTP